MNFYKQTYHLFAIKAPKIHTDLLWDLSFLFIGLSVIYFTLVFIHKKRLAKRLERIKQHKNELSPMISEFLFYEDDASKADKAVYLNLKIEIRQLILNKFNRNVLSDVLLDLSKDLSGETQNRIFELYKDLGLHQDAFKMLKSWRWELVSKAIQDLTRMQVSEAYSFITKFINDKRPTIRKQAEIAIVSLKYEGINYFLDTTKYKISEWQQLKLLDVIRNRADYQPPVFSAWLTSTNNHVVLFALRLIKFYNQNNANASLIQLLKHKNTNIKLEAIACIKEFYVTEAMDTLKLVFWKSSTDIKIAILDTIAELGSEDDIEFLELIERKISNFAVTSKALSSINAISPGWILPTKDIVETTENTIPEDLPTINEAVISTIKQPDSPLDPINSTINDLKENLGNSETLVTVEENKESKVTLEHTTEEITDTVSEIDVTHNEETKDHASKVIDTNKNKSNTEISTVNIDFLPIVILKTDQEQKSAIKNSTFYKPDDLFEPQSLKYTYDKKSELEDQDKSDTNDFWKNVNVDFLPLVIGNSEKTSTSATSKNNTPDKPLNSISVLFEEVTATPFEEVKNSASNINFESYNTTEINNIPTFSEEILVPEASENAVRDFDVIDPVFLAPLKNKQKERPMNDMFTAKYTKQQTDVAMTPQDEEKFKEILNSLIAIENDKNLEKNEVKDDSTKTSLEFDNEAIDITFIPLVTEDEETLNDIKKEAPEQPKEDQVRKEEPEFKATIPKAIITNKLVSTPDFIDENSEEATLQLLDDIEEMGDQREVPLLNEMIKNTKYQHVTSRLSQLIERFSDDEVVIGLVENEAENITLKPFNVFEDLFRVCDTEAKLILLDEVAAVGDAGDIAFLEGLLSNEDQDISKQANIALEAVQSRLLLDVTPTDDTPIKEIEVGENSKAVEEENFEEYNSLMEELEIDSPKAPSGVFDIDFEVEFVNQTTENELVIEKPSTKKIKTKSNSESIIDQICSFSHKIIDKFNG